jgi:glycerol-1-phosphatase
MKGTTGPLLDVFDLLLLDLDGVLYVGDQPVAGAASALEAVRDRGVGVAFVTNNAARTPDTVAEQLRGMGVAADGADVVTSAMAAARLLADDLEPGAAVLVVGGIGVRQALLDVGLRPVNAAGDDPVAVVQGWAAEVGWPMFAEATVAVRAGARWVATNLDATLPSPRGPLPGNGSMVAALATALGRSPEAVGKPEPALFQTARRLVTGDHPLVVGDRLDTDIAGARAAGIPGLLVLTGVSSSLDLLRAEPACRPDYVGRDLHALLSIHLAVEVDATGTRASCGEWVLRRSGHDVEIASRGEAAGDSDGLDGLRALSALAWATEPALSEDALVAALNTLDLD